MLTSRGVYRVGSVHSAGECPGGSVDQSRLNLRRDLRSSEPQKHVWQRLQLRMEDARIRIEGKVDIGVAIKNEVS